LGVPLIRDNYAMLAGAMTRHEAIAAVLEKAISGGELAVGARLPTVRALSHELKVSAATVVAAYTLLRKRGWTNGEVGRGTFVLGQPRSGAFGESGIAGAGAAPWRRRMIASSPVRLRTMHPAALDCTSGKPDPSLMLSGIVLKAWRRAISETHREDLQYASPVPAECLSAALAPRLAREGISLARREVVVGSSAQQLMVLALSVVSGLAPSAPRIVAVEEPGYQTVFDAFERLGFTLIGMEIDDEGVRPTSLTAAIRAGARAALFTPRAHNPTGGSWTEQRRSALGEILARYPDVLAIEDDHFADLAGTHPGSLLSIEAIADRVVYIRSFAKSIAPDIRVAVGVAGARLCGLLTEVKSLWDGWSSRLAQRGLALTLSDPNLDTELDRARQTYAKRRSAAVGVLTAELQSHGVRVSGGDGLNIWVNLPYGVDAREVVERAAAAGVLVVSGEAFFTRPGRNNTIRISIGSVDARQSELAAANLASAVLAAHQPGAAIPI
jgi:GntR family transcriptional regulator/MocR family aminotransferase